MTPLLLLVPGWGFDASFWDPLREALAPRETLVWDLGFRGDPRPQVLPEGRPVVAVGHSFGLLWLAQRRPLEWQALVSINGFLRFSAGDDFPEGVPPRVIDRMIARFQTTPEKVHADFLSRLGAGDAVLPGGLNRPVLADGLSGLRCWDARGRMVALALAGRSDPLLSEAMTKAALGGAEIVWHAGGHLLPRQDPAWCAARLGEFCDGLEEARRDPPETL